MSTPTENYIDEQIAKQLTFRRARGRGTYGKGLDCNDDYDWLEMAIEEALDLIQYLFTLKMKQEKL